MLSIRAATFCFCCHGWPAYDYDYDYNMAPQRGRPYGANLGSMGRNTGTWSIRSECLSNITSWSRSLEYEHGSHALDVPRESYAEKSMSTAKLYISWFRINRYLEVEQEAACHP